MKVANKALEVSKRPVRITDDQYEIWYSKPISLGKIDKINGYWYTSDGMRFISSRDAMEYLIRVGQGTEHPALPKPEPKVVVRKAATAKVEEVVNQNHPLFQKFLEFVEFSNRKRDSQNANVLVSVREV
jgi:hypothetical protein